MLQVRDLLADKAIESFSTTRRRRRRRTRPPPGDESRSTPSTALPTVSARQAWGGQRPASDALKGIGFMMLACVFFGAMHVGVRHVTQSIHPFEAAFFRNLFGLLVLVPSFITHGWRPLRTRRFGLHFARAALNVVAMLSFFYALSITPVVLVQALAFTAPLFTAVLAVLLLGERMRMRRISAIVVGFAGTLLIIRPGVQPIEIGPVLVLASSAVWGYVIILIKSLARTDSAVTITAYMVLLMSPMTLVCALFVWTWPSPGELAVLVAIGIAGTVAQMCMTQSLRLAETMVVLPFDFTKLVWGALFAWLLFGELIDTWTLVGSVVIFSGGLYLAYREQQLAGRRRIR